MTGAAPTSELPLASWPPVLIVDDDPQVCEALALILELSDIPSRVASDPAEALAQAKGQRFGAVIQDMNFTRALTSGDEGKRLFRALRLHDPELPIILLTGWTSLELAVALVKEGAADYISKPWNDERLVASLKQVLSRRLAEESADVQNRPGTRKKGASAVGPNLCGLVYRSPQMQQVVSLALQVATSDAPVLITGPNGTGKEKLAEIIQANSSRHTGPFNRVNAGAIPEELLESELFGSEAGAFTGANKARIGWFEASHGGTLFLDEIGTLSMNGQRKLLRVLQTGELTRLGSSTIRKADVRVISATNVHLQQEIEAGRFREDLYFRLNVIELRLPALRERNEDILPLAEHFLRLYGASRPELPWFSQEAIERLLRHPWPGNVRELHNRVQRAVLLARGSIIGPEMLDLTAPPPPRAAQTSPSTSQPEFRQGLDSAPSSAPDSGLDSGPRPATASSHLPPPVAPPTLEGAGDSTPALSSSPLGPSPLCSQTERSSLEQALIQASGNVSLAASSLGLSRQALYRRLEKLGISLERRLKH